jgi:hypothetical protein
MARVIHHLPPIPDRLLQVDCVVMLTKGDMPDPNLTAVLLQRPVVARRAATRYHLITVTRNNFGSDIVQGDFRHLPLSHVQRLHRTSGGERSGIS